MRTSDQKMQHTKGIKTKGTEEFLNRVIKRRLKKTMAAKTRKQQRKR